MLARRFLYTAILFCFMPLQLGNAATAPQQTGQNLTRIAALADADIFSPKSVIFSKDGSKFYVNSLEGKKTVVFDAATLKKIAVIPHEFSRADAPLFQGEDTIYDYKYNARPPKGDANCFGGKPVESALTHNGRYLWVPYYRRDWDKHSSSPSAVAIIDTQTDKIVRVMPTGPLPKMLTLSPDGSTLAIIHWGDNTIGLIDVTSPNPADFTYKKHLVDGAQLNLERISGDRDSVCGHCLRGAAFSPDSNYLLVGRMHGGGISVFDAASGERLGGITGIPATPRHLVMSADGNKLYVSSNRSGMISEIDLPTVLEKLRNAPNRSVDAGAKTLFVGKGARTIALSPDGKYAYAACNDDSNLVMVDLKNWQVIASAPVSPHAVGLAVNPAGNMIVTTSQGKKGHGGNRVDVFEVREPI